MSTQANFVGLMNKLDSQMLTLNGTHPYVGDLLYSRHGPAEKLASCSHLSWGNCPAPWSQRTLCLGTWTPLTSLCSPLSHFAPAQLKCFPFLPLLPLVLSSCWSLLIERCSPLLPYLCSPCNPSGLSLKVNSARTPSPSPGSDKGLSPKCSLDTPC